MHKSQHIAKMCEWWLEALVYVVCLKMLLCGKWIAVSTRALIGHFDWYDDCEFFSTGLAKWARDGLIDLISFAIDAVLLIEARTSVHMPVA